MRMLSSLKYLLLRQARIATLLVVWSGFPASVLFAYKVEGHLRLDHTWQRKIYLSAIPSIEDMNTASEDFIINVAEIGEDGHFLLSGNNLPQDERLYRLHVCKNGDPPATIFIGGKEENHFHFVMDNHSGLTFFNEQPLFAGAIMKGHAANAAFTSLREIIVHWKRPNPVNTKTNWEYNRRQLAEQLRHFADTCQSALVALAAIAHLNLPEDYSTHTDFYQNFLLKWEASAGDSPYYQALAHQIGFVKYQKSQPSFWPFWAVLPLLLLAFLAFFFLKKRPSKTLADSQPGVQNLLSVQEQRVFGMLSEGKSNKEISSELNIEVSTVKSHVSSIYSKLGVKSRKEIYNLKTQP
jgi:DNA-binding CsgD family transcriptional regulator